MTCEQRLEALSRGLRSKMGSFNYGGDRDVDLESLGGVHVV